jgi:quercetin dioxygenase-like cupin family protein
MITTVPPDKEWDLEAGYAQALAESGAQDSFIQNSVAGLHETDTIDIITVISGEIWALTETSETLLKPGDTIVQRGTKHAWRNRGDVPCKQVVIHFGAVR